MKNMNKTLLEDINYIIINERLEDILDDFIYKSGRKFAGKVNKYFKPYHYPSDLSTLTRKIDNPKKDLIDLINSIRNKDKNIKYMLYDKYGIKTVSDLNKKITDSDDALDILDEIEKNFRSKYKQFMQKFGKFGEYPKENPSLFDVMGEDIRNRITDTLVKLGSIPTGLGLGYLLKPLVKKQENQ